MSINLSKSFRDKKNNDLQNLEDEKEAYRGAYTLQKNRLDAIHRNLKNSLKDCLTEQQMFMLDEALDGCAGIAQLMGKNELRFMGVCREINLKTGKGWDAINHTEES